MSHKLYIKQKVLTLSGRDKFSVKDQGGNDVYYIKGKLFSLHSTLNIYNLQDQEVAKVEKEMISLRPTFDVYVHGKKYAKIHKKLSLVRDKYSIDLSVSDTLSVTGSIFDHSFKIKRNGDTIGSVGKAYIAWGDSYEITVNEPDPNIELLLVGLVLTLDTLDAEHDD